MQSDLSPHFQSGLENLLTTIYPDQDMEGLIAKVVDAFWPKDMNCSIRPRTAATNDLWSEDDAFVITYGNSIKDGAHKPLDLLLAFLDDYLADTVNSVHILPFFPFTSDDGFAVTDYNAVNSQLGDWADINRIASKYRLMSDLVLNHVSSQSRWFNAYLQGQAPYDEFFFEAKPTDDLSQVVRPRAPTAARSEHSQWR